MPDTTPPNDQPTVSFVDAQGRTITIPTPSVRVVTVKAPTPPATRTTQDTNLKHTFTDKDGTKQEVAITLRDESVQEIFERTPSWLTRWGATVVLSVLGLILVLMAVLPYPVSLSAATTLSIQPNGEAFAELSVPVAATTDLTLGQHVTIELDKYPAGRFGYLAGEVSQIQPPSTDDGEYLITVSLPAGLATSEKTKLKFERGLNGRARIVTNDQSLLRMVLN